MSSTPNDFSEMIQDSARGSLVLILGQMVATLISALGTIIIARVLGSTSYGIISIAQIPVTLFMLLLNNGVAVAMTNFIAEARHMNKQEEIKNIIYAGFIINSIIGLVATLILYSIAGYLSRSYFEYTELKPLIQILSISVIAQAVFNISMAILAGFEKMEQRSLISILHSVIKSLLGPLLVYLGYGLVGATLGSALPTVVSGVTGSLLVLYSIRNLWASRISIYTNIFRIARYAYPLFGSSILSGSLTNVLRFILPLYVSATVMGNYAASTSFSVLLVLFTAPLSASMLPLLSKLRPTDNTLGFVYLNIVKYESIIVFPLASAVFILADHMVEILYGVTYPLSPLYIRVLMLSYFFIGLGDGTTQNLLVSQGQTKVIFKSTLLFFVLGAPLGLFLIPRYGVLGFQFTTLFIPKLTLLYQYWWINRNYGIFINFKDVSKILLSSIIGLIICWTLIGILETNPWIELFTGGIVLLAIYLFLILFTGVLTGKNLDDIKDMADSNKLLASTLDPVISLMKRFTRD